MSDLANTKLVLFDLGNVVFEVDFTKTWKALGVPEPISKFDHEAFLKNEVFDSFERGKIHKSAFYAFLENEAKKLGSKGCEDLEAAWNACITGVIPGVDTVLADLRSQGVPIFALSNVCDVHFDYLGNKFGPTLSQFERVFSSFQLGLRKPEAAIYQKVAQELREARNCQPEQVLFLDDREENLKAAKMLGFQVEHCRDDSNLLRQIIGRYF